MTQETTIKNRVVTPMEHSDQTQPQTNPEATLWTGLIKKKGISQPFESRVWKKEKRESMFQMQTKRTFHRKMFPKSEKST